MSYDIALVPGDGIGNEVVAAARPVIDDVAERANLALEYTTFDWGSQRYRSEGAMMPEDGTDRLRTHDAIPRSRTT